MGNELLPLENSYKEKISIVILCAGEGKRLTKITKYTPKPLIKIERLNNISILQHIINLLINFEISQIGIVVGYLGDAIREVILGLEKKNKTLQNKIIIIDTESQYKLGPLYSFLSITKNKDFFTAKNHYLVIPGDTIFDSNIFKEIFSIISYNFNLIQSYPFIFYRKIGLKTLKEQYTINRKISNAEIANLGSEIIIKKISQVKIKEIPSKSVLNQLIPIIILSYDSITQILNLNRQNPKKTMWEILNYMIFNKKKILAFEIQNKNYFHDIDYLSDLKKIKKKRKGQ